MSDKKKKDIPAQEPENEEPAVVVPQKQPMVGMANIFSLFDF